MFRTLLKSKIQRATVTQCELHYEGSCPIGEDLLDAANICENEQVHVSNINNGECFVTCAIRAERGSRVISVNGSAARRVWVGDLLSMAAFGQVHKDHVSGFAHRLIVVDASKAIQALRQAFQFNWPDLSEQWRLHP
jgi:aspartate 1-decarboxylase